ncbi:hypothetical protein SBA4_960005 [Candidatus Sulfopaludibacter sp. SbA4]|nr:hypothetical protein SBA4_960005 [Candidatus Sulfopaludibacter sp. SbA4]
MWVLGVPAKADHHQVPVHQEAVTTAFKPSDVALENGVLSANGYKTLLENDRHADRRPGSQCTVTPHI